MEALERPHEAAYWDALYSESARAGVKTFSSMWQGVDLAALRGVLKVDLRPQDRVLILGAGDSGLPEELFDAGCRNVTAVDFSPLLVAAMAERSHGALWRKEDARQLSFPEGSFDVALDLGLLDSVAAGGEEEVAKALLETHRVLSPGGTYASVSTEPPLFRLPLFERGTGADAWATKVLFLPRPRELDTRVRRIDPALDLGKLSVYVSTKPNTDALNTTEPSSETVAVHPDGSLVAAGRVASATTAEEAPKEPQAQTAKDGDVSKPAVKQQGTATTDKIEQTPSVAADAAAAGSPVAADGAAGVASKAVGEAPAAEQSELGGAAAGAAGVASESVGEAKKPAAEQSEL